jgi:hypothetical protein
MVKGGTMTDIELARRIDALRADYAAQTGQPFKNFYCPILRADEPSALCRGHIINDAFGTCNEWLPQRADVDNFFGSAVEADLLAVVEDRAKDPVDIWLDPKRRRKHGPKLLLNDEVVEHYFPGRDPSQVQGHTLGRVIGEEGKTICNLALKVAETAIVGKDDLKLELVIQKDYRASVVASLLKAAHLSLFRILGYNYVLSPSGFYPANILGEFFKKYKPPSRCSAADVERYFRQHENMVSPMWCMDDSVLQGTVIDNRLLSCISSSGDMFAIGVIVKAGTDLFCVFLPGMERAINTYFSFIKEPPPSIAATLTQFRPASGEDNGAWEIPPGEPIRIPLKQRFPDDATAALESSKGG